MHFARQHGWDHLMLEATMEVNRRLEQRVPAVASPDKIDAALEGARLVAEAEAATVALEQAA
jgi:hypothetical protein